MKKEGRLTVVEIMGLGLLVLILMGVVLLSFRRRRVVSQQYSCTNKLRFIESAKEQWALAGGKDNGDPVVTAAVNQYLPGAAAPTCPGGGIYTYNPIGTVAECSIESPDHSY